MREHKITLRINKDLYVKLKERAEKDYRSVTSVARQAIALFLEKKEQNK